MEVIGVILIAGLAYSMSQGKDGLTTAIPTLGALALGAQRLLPALHQAYNSYSDIKGTHASFIDVLDLLEQPLPDYVEQPLPVPITFEKEICLSNLSFYYSNESPIVLDKTNLSIPKGARIGFIGTTGSGKSTLLDIIMGLLQSSVGELLIDSTPITTQNRRSWQAHIAHVPQNIYLSDSTIEENIAFGVHQEKIDHTRVEQVARQTQIHHLIVGWKDGYQTRVGERGARLSGGQRQRIGIARALYKQADVLIFDEATSALDNETERAVMEAIGNIGREITILIVAHRLTTLQGCDQIYLLDKGKVATQGTYKELLEGNEIF
jgi:ATP-binding cassette subfamily B protein